MATTIKQVPPNQIDTVLPLLLLAEPSESALRWGLQHLSDTVYRMDVDGELVGAVSMRWRDDPCEIEEIGIAPARQGQGFGRELIGWLVGEALRRGKRKMIVGTPNASINNIAFYQKVGFRMDHVRHDYFRYYREPRFENGIEVRDLLVFRRELRVKNEE